MSFSPEFHKLLFLLTAVPLIDEGLATKSESIALNFPVNRWDLDKQYAPLLGLVVKCAASMTSAHPHSRNLQVHHLSQKSVDAGRYNILV